MSPPKLLSYLIHVNTLVSEASKNCFAISSSRYRKETQVFVIGHNEGLSWPTLQWGPFVLSHPCKCCIYFMILGNILGNI